MLGPAADGGFYLIGTDRPIVAPFRFTTWGTGEVFSRTARELEAGGFRIRLAPKRNDVDCKPDLDRLDRDFLFAGSISVIIPTLTEARKLSALLIYLQNSIWPGDEIIVVQGGALRRGLRPQDIALSHFCVRPQGTRNPAKRRSDACQGRKFYSSCMMTRSPRRNSPT